MARILAAIGMVGMLISAAASYSEERSETADHTLVCTVTAIGDVALCE